MNETKNLKKYGLKENILNLYNEKYSDMYLGRILLEHKHTYKIAANNGELFGEVSGKFNFESTGTGDYPAVGDWVILDRNSNVGGNAIIHKVLPRTSNLSRKAAGTTLDRQIIATNIDIVFICMSLNNDFNLRKLERYLSVAWESGAVPMVALTKSDICDDIDDKLESVYSVALGVDVFALSALEDKGIEPIRALITDDKTVAFIGSSGVGKSTLINSLLSEEKMDTGDIRSGDDKGKHTTTHRELSLIPTGGVVIDTPGMRELQLFSVDMNSSFKDIETLSSMCKFHDCTHKSEPGCAINEAISTGNLTLERFNSYKKLQREIRMFEKKKQIESKRQKKKQNQKKSKKSNTRFSKMVLNSLDY